MDDNPLKDLLRLTARHEDQWHADNRNRHWSVAGSLMFVIYNVSYTFMWCLFKCRSSRQCLICTALVDKDSLVQHVSSCMLWLLFIMYSKWRCNRTAYWPIVLLFLKFSRLPTVVCCVAFVWHGIWLWLCLLFLRWLPLEMLNQSKCVGLNFGWLIG